MLSLAVATDLLLSKIASSKDEQEESTSWVQDELDVWNAVLIEIIRQVVYPWSLFFFDILFFCKKQNFLEMSIFWIDWVN